jgi:hypothetical protein
VESDFRFNEQEQVEHTTFSVSDNPELRLVVFLATAASNSIAKIKKLSRRSGKAPPQALA